jgi:hypothetical protein
MITARGLVIDFPSRLSAAYLTPESPSNKSYHAERALCNGKTSAFQASDIVFQEFPEDVKTLFLLT